MDNVLLDVGLPIVLAFVMVGIGLTLTPADFDRQRKTPKPLVVGVIGITLIVPLVSFGIAILFNLPAELAIGVVLLGATAGGTTSNVMTYLGGGNTALSLVLTVVANLATIISIPFWAGIALNRWGDAVEAATNVAVGFMDVAGLLVGLVLIPTSLGMLIRARRPALAARLENTVYQGEWHRAVRFGHRRHGDPGRCVEPAQASRSGYPDAGLPRHSNRRRPGRPDPACRGRVTWPWAWSSASRTSPSPCCWD